MDELSVWLDHTRSNFSEGTVREHEFQRSSYCATQMQPLKVPWQGACPWLNLSTASAYSGACLKTGPFSWVMSQTSKGSRRTDFPRRIKRGLVSRAQSFTSCNLGAAKHLPCQLGQKIVRQQSNEKWILRHRWTSCANIAHDCTASQANDFKLTRTVHGQTVRLVSSLWDTPSPIEAQGTSHFTWKLSWLMNQFGCVRCVVPAELHLALQNNRTVLCHWRSSPEALNLMRCVD